MHAHCVNFFVVGSFDLKCNHTTNINIFNGKRDSQGEKKRILLSLTGKQKKATNSAVEQTTLYVHVCDRGFVVPGSRKLMLCMLCRFVIEARQRSGKPYSPKSILQMMINLQSCAIDKNPTGACRFMDSKDQSFKPLHHVMNNRSKELLNDGVGAIKKQARTV